MDEDTIQQDVSAQNPEPTEKINPRLAALEAIAAGRPAQIEEANEDHRAMVEGSDASLSDDPVVKDEPADAPVFQRDGVWMTRVKVNGVEEEVPLDKVTARYQKDAAGDEKLRIAAEKERALAHQAEQLRMREAMLTQRSQQPSPPGDVGRAARVSEDEVAAAIYSGDEKQFAEKMRAYRESIEADLLAKLPKGEVVDPRAIAAQVESELQRKQAVTTFYDEFNDIANDPYLFNMANQFSGELLSSEPTLKPVENLRRAGAKVREWLAERAKQVSNAPLADDRTQRKMAAAAASAAPSSARAQIRDDAPKPLKPSDVIAEMRKARGQPV